MCTNLKEGCCSQDSLNAFKAGWGEWMKYKSAWFWTLSKWPQGFALLLKYGKKGLKCKTGTTVTVKAKKTTKKASTKKFRRLQTTDSGDSTAAANVSANGV